MQNTENQPFEDCNQSDILETITENNFSQENPTEIRSITVQRINYSYVKQEFLNVFGYDRGFFYTLKMLLLRPKQSLLEYLSTDRTKLMKPILFLFFTSFIFTVLNNWTQWSHMNFTIDNSELGNDLKDWLVKNYGYSILFIILFTAFWLRLFLRKKGFFYFEFVVILCYTMGFELMISVVGMGVNTIFDSDICQFIFFVLPYAYSFWVMKNLFGGKKRIGVMYFFSYLLGLATFCAILILFILLEPLLK